MGVVLVVLHVEDDEDDVSDGNGDLQADGIVSYFLAIDQVIGNERGRYVSVDVAACDVSNYPDLDPKDPVESTPVHYHVVPSPQFKNVENNGIVVASNWTSWVNHNTGNSNGEFAGCCKIVLS